MSDEIVKPICDPRQVATIIRSYPESEHISRTVLSLFDNVRPHYSPAPTLEFGGIVLTEEQIRRMVRDQARVILDRATPHARIVMFWKAESGRLYADLLAAELRKQSGATVVQSPIRTKWLRNSDATVVRGDTPESSNADFVLVVDFMCGSGGTLVAIALWLTERRIAPDLYVVLVNATNHHRELAVPRLLSPCFVWPMADWLIGFNSDCLSGGRQLGRDLPFLAFIKPSGEGIRTALADALDGGLNT